MGEEIAMSLATSEGKRESLMWVLTTACRNNHALVFNDNSMCYQMYEADITWCGGGCDCCEPDPIPSFSVFLAAETEEELVLEYKGWIEENL
jgi:hypothetical protein